MGLFVPPRGRPLGLALLSSQCPRMLTIASVQILGRRPVAAALNATTDPRRLYIDRHHEAISFSFSCHFDLSSSLLATNHCE